MAVVAVTRPDLDADEYRSQLWAVPTDGSASGPAADLRPPRQRAGVLARTAAGWPTSAPSRAAGRSSGCCRPPGGAPRRLTDHHLGAGRAGLVAGLAAAGLRRPGARAGPVRHGRGRRPGRRAAAADHHAAVPPGRRRLPRRPAQPGLRARPARPTSTTTPRPLPEPVQVTTGDADCVDVTWRPDGAELAFVSARHERADRRPGPRRLRGPRPTARGCGGSPTRGATARCPPTTRTGGRSTSPPSPTSGPTALDFVARQAVPCRVDAAGGALEPLLDPERAPPRRRDAGDGPGRRRRAGRACSARARCELLRVPLDGGAAGGAGRRAVHRARRRRRRGRRRRRRWRTTGRRAS